MYHIKPAMERNETDWMKIAGKQRFRRNESISIRLSEILTNELHKYLYPYSIIYYSKTSLSIYICLTEICKVTIACFIPTISVGFDPYSRKVYYLDDPVHLLVSCIEVVTNYEL